MGISYGSSLRTRVVVAESPNRRGGCMLHWSILAPEHGLRSFSGYRLNSAKLGPSPVDVAPKPPFLGQHLRTPGQDPVQDAETLKASQCWPKMFTIWPSFDHPSGWGSTKLPSRANLVRVRPGSARIRPMSERFRPDWVRSSPDLTRNGRIWSSIGRCCAEFDYCGAISADPACHLVLSRKASCWRADIN